MSSISRSPNQSEGLTAKSTITGRQEYITSTSGILNSVIIGTTLPIAGATTAVGVAIVDGSGNQITSFGGGTQYAEGATAATATGTLAMGKNSTTLKAFQSDSSGNQIAVGATASGSSLTVSPLTIGGLAKTAEPTSVADGQVVNALFAKSGKQIVQHALTEMRGNQNTTITSSTAETTIITANATYLLDLYGITVSNTSSTFTKVTIKDATSGTTRFIWSIPPQDMKGFMLPASDGHKQATVNNNWTLTCGTSVASIEVTALFNQRL